MGVQEGGVYRIGPRTALRSAAAVLFGVLLGGVSSLDAQTIPKTGWSLVYVDSQELVAENGAATNAFDGNTATIWHTKWSPTADPLPHEIQIDLGATYLVSAFRYRPRSNSANGRIRDWEFYVATSPGAWGAPVATGTFANSSTEKEVTFAAVTARYVRLRALSEVNGNPWTCVAELSLLGTPAETTTTTSTTTSTTAAPTTTTTSSTTTTTLAASLIPKAGWSLVYVDSQELVAENGAATNAFDGNTATIWHTKWSPTADPLPHEIQIDLGATYLVSAFRYRPRSSPSNGRIRDWEFYVATTPGAWGAPVATGTFANSSTEKEVTFAAVTARYVRLRALSEVNGNPWTCVAELSLLGTPAETTTTTSTTTSTTAAPTTTTTSSTTTTTLAASLIPKTGWSLVYVDSQELVAENGAATNAFDGNTATIWHTKWSPTADPLPHEIQIDLGATYLVSAFRYRPRSNSANGRIRDWEFYVATSPGAWGAPVATGTFANSSTEKEVAFAAVTARYVRLRALSEVNGNPWTCVAELSLLGTPAETTTTTSTTTSTTAAPTTTTTSSTTTTTLAASLIPKAGWSLVYVDSQELVAENGAATNAFDGNTATIWHTKWSPTADPLPHEIQIDLGATYLVSAFRYRPRSSPSNGRIRDWEFYVATSPGAWGAPVATGTFANSSTEKEVTFAAVTARYVRLRALSEVNGNPWTCVAELSLLGTPAETTTTTSSTTTSSTTTSSTTSTTLPPGSPDKALWRRWFVDSEELAAGNHPATAAFDANPATYWRSEFSVYNATHPHELQLNLGGLYTLTGFRYLPPQDGSTAGRINGFALYTSLDGTTWGSPVASGTLANSAAEQSVAFAPTVAQYVRLVSQSGHNADRSAAIAELTLLGTCVVPSVALVHPQRYDLTPTADLGVLVNTCYDPVLHAGWGVQLTLDTTTVRPLFTAPFSTTFSGLLPGEHTLEAMALDATATPVPGPDTQELVTAAATGGRYLVAVGDSITYGIGDNVPTDDTSPDGRDRSRGYPPILNGLLTTASGGLPHTVANEGVPGAKTSWGATVLPNLLAKHASAERVLVLLGTNDSNVFAPVPSGLGLNPGDPGYPGTVKANLQAALDAINAAGKSPVLLKLPPALARCSTCAPYPDPDQGDKNVNFIKPYNQVIDELVANPANNVTIPPPNLYAYFLAHPELYADFLHPTGVGYQHLARLVCQALTQTPCNGS